MSEEKQKSGLYYVIPSQVFADERLEHSEIVFYALLSGLAMSDGHSFASDLYLANRMRSKERTIRDWLLKLEGLGYILRETQKIGMTWDRKIYITHSNSKKTYERQPTAGSNGGKGVANGGTPPSRTAPHRRIVSEVKLEGEEKKEESLCIGRYVRLSQKEYDSLSSQHGVEKIASVIEEINDYLASIGNPDKYKDFAATIRVWLKRQASSSPAFSGRKPTNNPNDNKIFAEEVKAKFKDNSDIEIYSSGLFFNGGPQSQQVIDFAENGFKEQVLNKLRKWNLNVEGL